MIRDPPVLFPVCRVKDILHVLRHHPHLNGFAVVSEGDRSVYLGYLLRRHLCALLLYKGWFDVEQKPKQHQFPARLTFEQITEYPHVCFVIFIIITVIFVIIINIIIIITIIITRAIYSLISFLYLT